MNSEEPELKTRDPFQLELLKAVQKRRSHYAEVDDENNNNYQVFDANLNAKMSKYSSKKPTGDIKNAKHMFDSRDDEEDDTVHGGMLSKSIHSTDLNTSQKSNPDKNKNLKNSMERDSFLDAFLDRDANLKHEPLRFDHKGVNKIREDKPTPIPRPRPSSRSGINTEVTKPTIEVDDKKIGSKEERNGINNISVDYDMYARGNKTNKENNKFSINEEKKYADDRKFDGKEHSDHKMDKKDNKNKVDKKSFHKSFDNGKKVDSGKPDESYSHKNYNTDDSKSQKSGHSVGRYEINEKQFDKYNENRGKNDKDYPSRNKGEAKNTDDKIDKVSMKSPRYGREDPRILDDPRLNSKSREHSPADRKGFDSMHQNSDNTKNRQKEPFKDNYSSNLSKFNKSFSLENNLSKSDQDQIPTKYEQQNDVRISKQHEMNSKSGISEKASKGFEQEKDHEFRKGLDKYSFNKDFSKKDGEHRHDKDNDSRKSKDEMESFKDKDLRKGVKSPRNEKDSFKEKDLRKGDAKSPRNERDSFKEKDLRKGDAKSPRNERDSFKEKDLRKGDAKSPRNERDSFKEKDLRKGDPKSLRNERDSFKEKDLRKGDAKSPRNERDSFKEKDLRKSDAKVSENERESFKDKDLRKNDAKSPRNERNSFKEKDLRKGDESSVNERESFKDKDPRKGDKPSRYERESLREKDSRKDTKSPGNERDNKYNRNSPRSERKSSFREKDDKTQDPSMHDGKSSFKDQQSDRRSSVNERESFKDKDPRKGDKPSRYERESLREKDSRKDTKSPGNAKHKTQDPSMHDSKSSFKDQQSDRRSSFKEQNYEKDERNQRKNQEIDNLFDIGGKTKEDPSAKTASKNEKSFKDDKKQVKNTFDHKSEKDKRTSELSKHRSEEYRDPSNESRNRSDKHDDKSPYHETRNQKEYNKRSDEKPYVEDGKEKYKEDKYKIEKDIQHGSSRRKEFAYDEGDGRTTHENRRDNIHGDELASPRQRSQLTRQGHLVVDPSTIDQNRNKNYIREPSKGDEDLDSLFDAGSKRTASVKKEQIKSEKLKDHLRKTVASDKERNQKDSTPKHKGPMKANLPLDQAAKKTTLTKTQREKPRNKPLSASHRGKSQSYNNISNIRPSPRSTSPSSYDMSKLDAGMLREQIYSDWLQRKNSFTMENSKKTMAMKEQEAEEKERQKRERREDAQKSFDAWSGSKTEKLQSKKVEEKKKKQLVKEKEDEKLQKKLESKKFFDVWKQNKDVELKESHRKKLRGEKQNKSKQLGDKIEKSEDAKKVFDNWKSRKDEKSKDTIKEKRLQKKKEREEELDKQERKEQASRTFEAWKETRGKASSRPSSASLQQRPWCPSSRQRSDGIPATVQPVIVRNTPAGSRTRTMSATARLQSNSKRSK